MKIELLSLILLLSLAQSAVASADTDCEAALEEIAVVDAYDPEASPQKRNEAVQALDAISVRCLKAAYTLGQIYRHGPDLAGNPVPRDLERAHALILSFAEDGYVRAYADLAEMALSQKQPREAMKWTQVYLYLLSRHSSTFEPGESFDRHGYNADLLARADAAWRKARPALDRGLKTSDLQEYLKPRVDLVAVRLKEREEEMRKLVAREEPDDLRFKRVGGCSADLGRISAGYASYLIEVQPNGEVSRVVLENFAPQPEVGERLRKCANAYAFEAFPGSKPKIARVPIAYGYASGPGIRFKPPKK